MGFTSVTEDTFGFADAPESVSLAATLGRLALALEVWSGGFETAVSSLAWDDVGLLFSDSGTSFELSTEDTPSFLGFVHAWSFFFGSRCTWIRFDSGDLAWWRT